MLLISKKGTSCVSFWDGLKLRELLRRIRAWSSFAQNLEKAHLPKTMKSPSLKLWVYFEQQKSVRVCFAKRLSMFNASSSKSNSSTSWGTLLGALMQVHFQTSVSSTTVPVHHLYFPSDVLQVIRLHMVWNWWQSAKSVFLLTSTINQAKFPKSMLHRLPSHLAQKTVLLCTHRFSTKPRKGTSAQNHEKSKFSSRKLWVYFEQQNQSVFVLHRDFPCSMSALQKSSSSTYINQRHSSLHKAAKKFWSCSHTEAVSLSDLGIKYNSASSSSLFHFRCS